MYIGFLLKFARCIFGVLLWGDETYIENLQTDRPTDRPTDRQTDRQVEIRTRFLHPLDPLRQGLFGISDGYPEAPCPLGLGPPAHYQLVFGIWVWGLGGVGFRGELRLFGTPKILPLLEKL